MIGIKKKAKLIIIFVGGDIFFCLTLKNKNKTVPYSFPLRFTVMLFFPSGVHGDSFTVLQAPEFVSFQKGDWPVSGEKIPDLVALTMGFSIQEVIRYFNSCSTVLLVL